MSVSPASRRADAGDLKILICETGVKMTCIFPVSRGLAESRIRVGKVREGILNTMIPLTLNCADPRRGVSAKSGTEEMARAHRARDSQEPCDRM